MRLGNLKIEELCEIHKINMSSEDKDMLEQLRQDDAQNIRKGKFHIFDIPRDILCGDMETAILVRDTLTKSDIKGSIQISITS